jgi:cytoskeleton protein RodZ
MSEVADTVGQRLKAERERKGLSAQKAADQLHLDGWVIDALESDDYARIGPSVYGKGHLKRYAGLLGLPAAEILEAYDTRAAAPAPSAPPALRVRASTTASRGMPWVPIAGFAVLAIAIAIAIAGVLWWKPWHPRTAAVPATTAAAPAAAAIASADEGAQPGSSNHAGPGDRVMDGQSGGALAAGGSAEGIAGTQAVGPDSSAAVSASDADSTAGLGRARLRLSFSADSWVDVHDATGRRLFAGNGRANSVKTIAGAAPMKVYLGFASGVQLEVNNRAVAIGPQFVAGDVAHFEAGADGVLRRDPHAPSAGNPHPRG